MGLEASEVTLTVHHGRQVLIVKGKMGRCRGKNCKAPVAFVTLPSGKTPPYDLDGTPHYATCPDADSFRKSRV